MGEESSCTTMPLSIFDVNVLEVARRSCSLEEANVEFIRMKVRVCLAPRAYTDAPSFTSKLLTLASRAVFCTTGPGTSKACLEVGHLMNSSWGETLQDCRITTQVSAAQGSLKGALVVYMSGFNSCT
jgi:hypothetical protein